MSVVSSHVVIGVVALVTTIGSSGSRQPGKQVAGVAVVVVVVTVVVEVAVVVVADC